MNSRISADSALEIFHLLVFVMENIRLRKIYMYAQPGSFENLKPSSAYQTYLIVATVRKEVETNVKLYTSIHCRLIFCQIGSTTVVCRSFFWYLKCFSRPWIGYKKRNILSTNINLQYFKNKKSMHIVKLFLINFQLV